MFQRFDLKDCWLGNAEDRPLVPVRDWGAIPSFDYGRVIYAQVLRTHHVYPGAPPGSTLKCTRVGERVVPLSGIGHPTTRPPVLRLRFWNWKLALTRSWKINVVNF
jgi:hypothetical protein